MIEILKNDNQIINYKTVDDIEADELEFYVTQFIDYSAKDIAWAEKSYKLDISVMNRFEDIEISSHFIAEENQVSFHISIPYYDINKELSESPVFFMITDKGLFLLSNHEVDDYLNRSYDHKFSELDKRSNIEDFINFQIEFISDYYADITEAYLPD